jgi:hypothetical protein
MHSVYVMSAIKSISNALGYDACEAALAAGFSLAAVYALAAQQAECIELADDSEPVSAVAATAIDLSTIRVVA